MIRLSGCPHLISLHTIVTGKIPLEEIPSLFRAVGFYPSESEVSDMMSEVRYKTFVNTGETQDFVELVSGS
jgi:Ca2+-binding EF-hand superfamily protein